MRSTRAVPLLLAAILIAGCAVRAPQPDGGEHDPLEGFNRKMFWFNDKVDTYALEPVAKGWRFVAPHRVRLSVSNFFENLLFPVVTINDLLQGKVTSGAVDVGRFAVNTTVGVLGFFDPASGWGMEGHEEDFGQTLGRWGVPSGPYLVLPLLGPSSPRDAVGIGADYAFSVAPFFVDQFILTGARVFSTVNERSRYIDEVQKAKESAFDYYVFVRNAYIQRRRALVEDRKAMPEEEQEDLYNADLEPLP
jgi:phospholipid-binding lipoprotein MlaA